MYYLTGVTDHTESVNPRLNFTDEQYQDVMRKYFAAVTGIDENFGRLLQNLKDNGIYDDTIIVLNSRPWRNAYVLTDYGVNMYGLKNQLEYHS